MLVGMHFLNDLKQSSGIRAALSGIRPSVVGMLFAAAFILGNTAPHHWGSVVIFVAALTALTRFKVEAALILPIVGIASLVIY